MLVESRPDIDQSTLSPRERSGAPLGWQEAHKTFWKQFEKREFEEGTNARWEERTGLAPEDSHFTLIVPIRNEEKYLPDALGSLIFSDVPSTVHINVVLVTNDSVDASANIVNSFMHGIGEVHEGKFDPELQEMSGDSELDTHFTTTRTGNMQFTHVTTPTPGKANALNVGNAIARENNHQIAMSVDANNFLEPEAIANMFGASHKSFVDKPDGTVVLYGNDCLVMPSSSTDRLKQLIKKKTKGAGISEDSLVHGAFMAWNTDFIDSIDGIPQVACEDYALGVAVRRSGKTFDKVDDANIWTYESNTARERIRLYARCVRGKLQMMDQDPSPELREMIMEEANYMRPFGDRVKALAQGVRNNKAIMPFLATKFIMHEIGIWKGKRDFAKNPDNHSWESIASTK